MKLYKELEESINQVIEDSNETDDFKKRFRMLIINYFDDSHTPKDILTLIDLVKTETAQ